MIEYRFVCDRCGNILSKQIELEQVTVKYTEKGKECKDIYDVCRACRCLVIKVLKETVKENK